MASFPLSKPGLRLALNQARGWGWPGALGLAALLMSLAGGGLWLPAIEREAAALGADADVAELQAVRQSARRSQTAQTVQPPQRFRDGFPPARARQERLAALLALAVEHGLAPARTEFRLSRDPELDLLRYSVSMPLVGRYAELRAFIEEAQARDPALGLDRLRLRRVSTSATTVDSELGWTFYMQPEQPFDARRDGTRGAAR